MITMNKTLLTLSVTLLPLSMYSANGKATKGANKTTKSPNIIVIMCDDLGYEDVSFNLYETKAGEVNTPNIDKIANEGVKFTAGYTTYSVSGPSRAGFMTGRYPQRFGFESNPLTDVNDLVMGLPLDEKTIAESVGEVGYKSGIIGKWHLGAHVKNHPCNRGFDEFYGHLGGGHRYHRNDLIHPDSYKNNVDDYRTYIMRNHEHVDPQAMPHDYITDNFTHEALDFVTRHKDEPFFLYLAYNAPHGPLQSRTESASRGDSMEVMRRIYLDMVAAVDEGVGMLLDKLDKLGIGDDTIIFFLSDNGGNETIGANNGILRAGKASIYEGGYRVPFAMRWRANVSPTVYENPISALDIFATISSLTSSPVGKPLDGVNIIPYVKGEVKGEPHPAIYLRKDLENRRSMRLGDYKLIMYPQTQKDIHGEQIVEVYNVRDNMGENGKVGKGNIAKKDPAKVAELKSVYEKWSSEMAKPLFNLERK